MLKTILFSVLLLYTLFVNGQYSIESYSKSELGIPTISTFRKVYLPNNLIIERDKFLEREKYINFYEADNTIYYYYQDTLYDFVQSREFFVDSAKYFLYEQESYDTIPDYILKFKPKLKKYRLHYFIDTENRIWFYSNQFDGIMLIVEDRLVHYNSSNGFFQSYISNIFEDNMGNVWVYSSTGISVFSNKLWITLDKTKDNKRIRGAKKVVPFSKGQVIILTKNGRLLSYKEGEVQDLNIMKIKHDNYRDVSNRDDDISVYYKNNKPNDILVVDTSEIWISFANNELCRLSSNNEMTFYVQNDVSIIRKLNDYYKDTYNNKWLISGKILIGLPRVSNKLEIKLFDDLYFKGFYEGKHRLWFMGNNSSIYFDYNTRELIDINDKYNIEPGATELSTALHELGNAGMLPNVGAKAWIDYFYSGILENGYDTSLYLQYGIGTVTKDRLVVDIETLKEDSLILLFLENNCINLTDELKDKDNRPLGAFLDSSGNFWIDTPTSIHKISLK